MKKILVVALAALWLGGCGAGIKNPITSANIYQTKLVYAATETAAAKYNDYCWARPYAVLMTDPIAKPICANRRPVRRAIKSASITAGNAIDKADAFVTKNPTLDATSLIDAATSAVSAFRNVTPAVPLP